MLQSELGKSIQKRRQELKVTQLHLAALAGISKNTLYKLERGQSNPTLDIIFKLADVLGMEIKFEAKKV